MVMAHALEVTVPDGLVSGDVFVVLMPSGKEVDVTVPDGTASGSTILVSEPEAVAPVLEVNVPPGVSPGEKFTVQLEGGRYFDVELPPGVREGETMEVEVPGDMAPAAETAASAASSSAGGASARTDDRLLYITPDEQVDTSRSMPLVTSGPGVGAPPPADRKAGRELVFALVEHAQKVLQNEMAPFLEAHCHLFEQDLDELRSGAGETHEQYSAFTAFVAELDGHFETFVQTRGFGSAVDCFAAIDAAVVQDAAEQKREMQKLEARLRSMQRRLIEGNAREGGGSSRRRADSGDGDDESTSSDEENDMMMMMPLLALGGGGGGSDDENDEDGGGGGGDGPSTGGGGGYRRLPMMPLMFFGQSVSLEDTIEQALTLTHYETFSGIMRMKARQVMLRRQWLAQQATRAEIASRRRVELDGWDPRDGVERLSELWSAMGARILSLAPGPAAEMMAGLGAARTSDAELGLLTKFTARGGEPPADANEKRELFHLLGAPFSRLAMLAPQSGIAVMQSLKIVQEKVADSTKLGEQKGCVDLILDTMRTMHGLIGIAESETDNAMEQAETKAAALRRAYGRGAIADG